MKPLLGAAGLLAVALVCTPQLSAQWPSYPTPGASRTPDGGPILDAPTPRTPDGKPDLSGMWRGAGGGGGRGRGAAAGRGGGAQTAPALNLKEFFQS